MPTKTPRRPTVNARCVANHYAGPRERIIEFSLPGTDAGGLISVRAELDGRGKPRLQVNVYRQTRTRVFVDRGQGKRRTSRCGDEAPRIGDDPIYRCTRERGHAGDHAMTSHPMVPTWK